LPHRACVHGDPDGANNGVEIAVARNVKFHG
jgi:hypothetical protein